MLNKKLNMTARFIGGVFLCVLVVLSGRVNAANITPSDVYQETENIRLYLEHNGHLNTQIYAGGRDDTALRHPRHVIQKAQECDMLFSKILRAQNVEPSPIPELKSVREITPSDVMAVVKHLKEELYKVGTPPKVEAKFQKGKQPGDVYNNLKHICGAVEVKIEPSDVYRVAVTVNENLNKIQRVRGYDFELAAHKFDQKTPKDVYKKTWALLADLRILALNPDFAIPGGVIVPNEIPQGEVVPQNVIALMNDALAETAAIKYTLAIQEHTVLPPYQQGKTPSDVFAQADLAHRVVIKLLEREAEE